MTALTPEQHWQHKAKCKTDFIIYEVRICVVCLVELHCLHPSPTNLPKCGNFSNRDQINQCSALFAEQKWPTTAAQLKENILQPSDVKTARQQRKYLLLLS